MTLERTHSTLSVLSRGALAFGLAGAVLLGGAACESEQKGRVPLTKDTEAEKNSDKILPTALLEFSDVVPETLKSDLRTRVPLIRDAIDPVTVILGDVDNQTQGVVLTSDFVAMLNRIRANLINSDSGRQKLRFVENRSRLARLAAREGVVPAEAPSYDPETTYALTMNVYKINRGNTNLYFLASQLTHFGTNQIVFEQDYEIKQVN
ncbi:MAG: hypothetical protein AAF288_10495 [Planctomycetota bacterium]